MRLRFVRIFLLVSVLAGCAGQKRLAPTATPQAAPQTLSPSSTPTPTPAPEATAMPLLTGSPLPTELYATMTFQADARPDCCLLPGDIDPETAALIQLALETRLMRPPHRGEQFFSYMLLAPVEEGEDGSLMAYLRVRDQAFYVEQGELKPSSSGEIPAALKMQPTAEGWHVDLETPRAGNWGPSIREIFPEALWPLIFNSPSLPFEALEADIVQQAEAYFGLAYDADKYPFPIFADTPTPQFLILTLTPTPTVDIHVLEPDVSVNVISDAERIAISVDLYPEVSDPFQKGLLSAGWHIDLFPRGDEGDVFNLNARKTYSGPMGAEFYVRLAPEELLQRYGDWRAYVVRISAAGEVFWQGYLYLDFGRTPVYVDQPEKVYANDYSKDVHNGLITGKPLLLSDTVSPVFTLQDDWIVVKEPPGGFYALTYEYALVYALGLTSRDEAAKLSQRLQIELFPYLVDSLYEDGAGEPLTGHISDSSGILHVTIPFEWLEQARQTEGQYLLRIGDNDGNLFQEVGIWFMPFVP